MKKSWLLILTITIVFALYGCVSVKVDWAGASGSVITPDVKTTEKPRITATPRPTESVHCPMIEETVIYDSDVVTITVTGLEYNSSYKAFVVKTNIQNHSEEKIYYDMESANVNGYTISTYSFGEIFGGMEADADFGISRDELKLPKIEYIREISFTFDCQYSDNREKICSATATLLTSDYEKDTETIVFDGTELFTSDDYTILAAPYSKPTVGNPLVLYIENNTDDKIRIWYDNVAINNKMVADFTSGPEVLPHSKRVELMELYYFGDEPDIDTIDSVTLGLEINPQRQIDYYSFYDDSVEVPPVTVLFPK